MKMSQRAKRMARSHSRHKAAPKLNLTSLMDIFTILVFFLMVNSSDVQVLDSKKSIKLPESFAEKKPQETLVVMVNDRDLLVQGRKLADVPTVISRDEDIIPELDKELKYQASRKPITDEAQKKKGRDITIMGDKEVPYKLLKKIMTTCAQAEFRNISLAVSKVADKNIVDSSAAGQGG